ncbi:MAG: uracil-DNA glycosylase [Acidobacteria bacterium]|nr:uracil-DNA glycosylase [Acidobacteriota bacterium]
MSKNNDQEKDSRTGGLFGDISLPQTLIQTEVIDHRSDDSLEKILADLKNSHVCGACKPGMPVVFGVGHVGAEVMLIGEGPGIDDIKSGEPFQGQAGILLAKMLAAIDLRRSDCYICNVIKCVPAGERNFSLEEIICLL